jgi:TolB protein
MKPTKAVEEIAIAGGLCRAWLLVAALSLLTIGCGRDDTGVSPRPDTVLAQRLAFPGNVSNPVSATAVAATTGASATAEQEVVYISLQRGIYPAGLSATVVNRRTGAASSIQMVEGGFDPVAIGAQAADTVNVDIRVLGGATLQTFVVVPRIRRPVVVRTDPPPKKRDVPLNAVLRVIFSEPIDPASLTAVTLDVASTGAAVAGSAELVPDQPWIAQFTPNAPLAPNETYELAVTDQIRDLNGEALETATSVTFTTGSNANLSLDGRIAFQMWSGSFGVYTMNPDGSGVTWLTDGNDPSFSPDGTRIAFWRYLISGLVHGARIYIMDADGSNVTEVASDGYQPSWSPDGSQLVYGCGGICVINVDGTGRKVLTDPERPSYANDVCIRDTDPAWSPDGSTIAFTRWPDARIPVPNCLTLGLAISFPFDFWTEVWFVGSNGSDVRPLRDAAGINLTYAGWPAWSPDGNRLAIYLASGGGERIAVVNADGSDLTTVVQRDPPDWSYVLGSPAWSPDGRQIVFGGHNQWGFADARGAGVTAMITAPFRGTPYSLSWSWSRK